MVVIGLDPHKDSHTAAALDAASQERLCTVRISAGVADYRRLLRWAAQFGQRRWAVEGACGLGLHLAVAQGEIVADVATTATARVRQLSCGGTRDRDVLDAAAAASVAALQGETAPVRREGGSDALALLDEPHPAVRGPYPASNRLDDL